MCFFGQDFFLRGSKILFYWNGQKENWKPIFFWRGSSKIKVFGGEVNIFFLWSKFFVFVFERVQTEIGGGDHLFIYLFFGKKKFGGGPKYFFWESKKIFFGRTGVLKKWGGRWCGDQWESWNWSCDFRANEKPKKTMHPMAQTYILTDTQTDMATLWLNLSSLADSVKTRLHLLCWLHGIWSQ